MSPLGTQRTTQLADRILELWERTGDPGLGALVAGDVPRFDAAGAVVERGAGPVPSFAELTEQGRTDLVSTVLMACFKNTGDAQVFALLHDLNERSLLLAIRAQIRRAGAVVDARDVLQEVFLNIFRYPHRFVPERADAFRNWGHRIARNTLLKFLKSETRRSRVTALDEDLEQRVDPRDRDPLHFAADAESARVVDRAFLLWLNLYLLHFEKLSEREKRALTMVEVDGLPYRQVAAALGIRLENLKMVVFRGRRKILRGMNRSLARLGMELQRARRGTSGAPRASSAASLRRPGPARWPAPSVPADAAAAEAESAESESAVDSTVR